MAAIESNKIVHQLFSVEGWQRLKGVCALHQGVGAWSRQAAILEREALTLKAPMTLVPRRVAAAPAALLRSSLNSCSEDGKIRGLFTLRGTHREPLLGAVGILTDADDRSAKRPCLQPDVQPPAAAVKGRKHRTVLVRACHHQRLHPAAPPRRASVSAPCRLLRCNVACG